ncbi:carbohydrate sulfotransferase 3 [Trichoplusia ni]|uniref:Carbohydrate sulfotransferase 3 n=1 Tax=Trichoplusia ni TaxID=7111 RepID=A0A7E5VC37_TRINI|nr:carbohydrate sulfotransferase 3 [Trichoplusia ni]
MLRRVNFYLICCAFGLSVLLILAGSRYADNTYYRPSIENRRNIRNFLKVDDPLDDMYMQSVTTNSYNGSPDIEKILNKTRYQIKYNLSKYNFSKSGVRELEDLVMESGGKPLHHLIVSTWRSGTTFLGELLNSIPGTFYYYEPFMKDGEVQKRGPLDADRALTVMKDMFKCRYTDKDYYEYGKKRINQFSHNTRLWDHCKYKRELCYDSEFTSRLCRLFPFMIMKVLRVRLRLIQSLLDDKELNLKVLLLIRDPRGVMESRRHRSWCPPSPDCWNPSLVCADMISDYVAAGRLLQQYPDKLMVLRYEELALKPNVTAHRILKFLKVDNTPQMSEFLQTHTNVEVAGVSSTFRVSREVPFRWKYILDFDYVEKVQMACKEAMLLWGYRLAYNATHMKSTEFNPIEDYTISQ